MTAKKYLIGYPVLLIGLLLWAKGTAFTQESPTLSKGQKIYVPAYSHIYTGNRQIPSLLTVTLSIRNTDMRHAIEIVSVDYYDTKGVLIKKYLPSSVFLKALESIRYVVDYDDKTGGSGANFIVEWRSENSVNPPIMETIMIGSRSSFTSRGRVLLPVQ
ncbi:DUF3124 domain-containing protein [Desulfobacter curvatus]|uniref:DUF3124 domain-containing protein n=1 Tax=Desulfobacter curvatus TaxID=2290 RepID=UPI00038257C0|nr:DUF3124 domain-containing protein [Desulfobacter curvatus]